MKTDRESMGFRIAVCAVFLVVATVTPTAATPGDPVVSVGSKLASTAGADEKKVIDRLVASALDVSNLADLTIDYPLDRSIFPPEFMPPTVHWHDSAGDADRWLVEVTFGEDPSRIHVLIPGLPPDAGEIDPLALSGTNEVYRPTPYQASAKTWKPAVDVWSAIKELSVDKPAEVTLYGFNGARADRVLSRGRLSMTTSSDPVGAPVFYRDVPLSPTPTGESIMPLPKGALPLIKWRLRDISLPESRVMLTDMPSCANCHSFSADGKTMGMDIDGPRGDKGAYALAAIEKNLIVDDDEIITWNSFKYKPPGHKTLGFLSRVSPDGQWVVSTLNERIYVRNFPDYKFGQVFYPTEGILAFFNRKTGEMLPLPGADDPEFVHVGGVWTPDGKTIIFSRAKAKEPYPEGRPLAQYAGDPNELPMQYDLYRLDFNDGRGGVAEPITGASANGMSNTFPKVSPDGKWIVFVKCKNGQLMRPDSTLWILPVEGGEARRMRCNTRLMNSWHSFSPNSRWLVFSSKANTPFTQMMLTHIDEKGIDSPALLIENSTASNRAVNIPEFVNVDYDQFVSISVPIVEYYRHYHRGNDLAAQGDLVEAAAAYESALEVSKEPRIHDALARVLIQLGQEEKALEQLRASLAMNQYNFETHLNMGYLLTNRGEYDDALQHLDKAVRLHPRHAQGWFNRATLLLTMGRTELALADYSEALNVEPRYPEALNGRGIILLEMGEPDDALKDFNESIRLKPDNPKALYFRAVLLKQTGDLEGAMSDVEAALAVAPPNSPHHGAIEQLQWQIQQLLSGKS